MPATITTEAVEKTIIDALSHGAEPSEITRDATFEELDVVRKIKTVGDAIDLVVSKAR